MTSRDSLRRPSRRKPLAACVAAIFALSAPVALHAASWPVSNCKDDGSVGSLRWGGNNAVSGDTIDIAITDNSACTHNFHNVTEVVPIASVITLATGVTINGPGSSTFGINASASGRVLKGNGTLTVNDVAIFNGKYVNSSNTNTAYGGCIFTSNALTLNGVYMYSCASYNTAGGAAKGGAAATFFDGVTVTNSTISHSKVSGTFGFGGAFYSYVDFYSSNTFIDHAGAYTTASATGDALGGASFTSTGKSTLVNSFVEYAQTKITNTGGGSANGGAIWSHGNAYLNGTFLFLTYANTQATGATKNSLGGGVFSATGGVSLTNGAEVALTSTYTKGGNSRGGGIYSTTATGVLNSFVGYNTAGHGGTQARGGGIFAKAGLTMKYSNLLGNYSSSQAGGAYVGSGDTTIRYSTIANNSSNASGCCGALWHNSSGASSVTIENSTISGNSGGANGGTLIYAYATTVDNSTIAYNHGGGFAPFFVGGGNAGATLALNSTLMSGNSYGAGPTQGDFNKSAAVTFTASSSNNFIRTPVTSVPGGTIVGQCPLLHKLRYNGGPTATHRLGGGISAAAGSKNPAVDTGSNPLSFTGDQRQSARVSGTSADVGAYEVDQTDIIFGGEFEGCP